MTSSTLDEFTLYCIFLYEKKYNIANSTFVFTNALVDMIPDANVNNENSIETRATFGSSPSIDSINNFFQSRLNHTFEDWFENINIRKYFVILV